MRHSQISSASAETWRCHAPPRPLSGQSATVARALGYTLTGGDGAAAVPLLDASLLEPLNDAACGAAGGGGAGCGVCTPEGDGAHLHEAAGRRVVPVVIAPGSDGELLPFGALGAALEAAAVPLLGLRLTADVPRDCFAHAAAAYVAPLVTRLAAMRADGVVLAGLSSGGCLASNQP